MKKFLIILFVCALLPWTVCAESVYGVSVFTDVKETDWCYDELLAAKDLGIIEGFKDGSFRPKNKVSYGQFLRMLFREKLPCTSGSSWASGLYDAGLEAGYFTKLDISRSRLSESIPRKFMALLMAKKLLAEGAAPEDVPVCSYTDVSSSDKYEYYIAVCSEAGVLEGFKDGSFRPDAYLNRAQAAAAFVRLDAYIKANADLGAEEPQSPSTALERMDGDARKILDSILASLRFSGKSDRYSLSYDQPEIPEEYHLSIEVDIYEKSGSGTPTLYRYISDEAYLTHPDNYNPSAHAVSEEIDGVSTQENKLVLCQMTVRNESSGEMASYQLVRDFDGSISLDAIWNPPAEDEDSLWDSAITDASYVFEWK